MEKESDENKCEESILTGAYECFTCGVDVKIEDTIQGMHISLFKNSYLNARVVVSSPSLALYLKQASTTTTMRQIEQDSSYMYMPRVARIDHFYHVEHPLILSTYVDVKEIENEENEWCRLCEYIFTEVVTIYSCKECKFFLHKSCVGLPELIKTTLHPQHLLRFRPPTKNKFACDGCDQLIHRSPRYTCQECDFDLHFGCVLDWYYPNFILGKNRCHYLSAKSPTTKLSRSLSFPMVRERKDQIIFLEPPPNVQGISLTLSSFLNFRLARVENNVDQFRHSFDKHPLVLLRFKEEYARYYNFNCKICNVEFLPDDPIYDCHECGIFLHESCAKLPQTMRSTLHPAHMLQLLPRDQFQSPVQEPRCQLCDMGNFYNWNYCCNDCAIYFHIGCVSAYSFEDHKTQEHTFRYVKPYLFTCDACGVRENEERFSFMCTSCPMQVHKRCSGSFPRTVKHKLHHHKLNLTYSFEVDFDYANETCRICFNQMNNVYCMYRCDNCTYITHVRCSTSKYIVEDESIVNKDEESVTLTEEEEADVARNQLQHFSHPHELIFTDEEPKNIDAVCDACVSPIISAPFYACANTENECNFYLHKHCFDLPLEIQHPLHGHRLTLTSEGIFFRCYGCGFRCNGFMYSCYLCEYYIDIRCSLLSDTLKHDGHECTLTLIDYKYVRADKDDTTNAAVNNHPKCSVCDGLSYTSSCKFSCRRCNFHLDLGCALSPKSVTHECPKHDWKPHPLQLTYGGIPDASGIYFCDMCEESRDINHWFYNCDDCRPWSNHPKCVLGEFQFKYGKTYERGRHDDHKVQLVKKALKRYNPVSCAECDKPLMDDSPLFCGECNLYFHRHCM